MNDDGGPAFPVNSNDVWNGVSPSPGMTLRDYFAAAAMQGWLSTFAGSRHPVVIEGGKESCAKLSYAMADAMLSERAKVE